MKLNKSFITASLVISSTLITSCSYFSSNSKTASTAKTSKAARSTASVDGQTPAQEAVCDELIVRHLDSTDFVLLTVKLKMDQRHLT